MIDFSFSSRPQYPHLTLRPTSCDQMSHFRRHWFTFEHVPPCHLSEDTSWHFLLCRSPRSLLGWQKPIPNTKKKTNLFQIPNNMGRGGVLYLIFIFYQKKYRHPSWSLWKKKLGSYRSNPVLGERMWILM